MARSRVGTLTAIVHGLYAGAAIVLSIYLFWQSHVYSLSAAANSSRHAHSMLLGGFVIGAIGVFYAVCAMALWRDRGWARWLSMSVNAVGLVIFASEFLGDYKPDGEDWLAVFILCVPLLLSLWNTVQRRRGNMGSPAKPAHVSANSAPS